MKLSQPGMEDDSSENVFYLKKKNWDFFIHSYFLPSSIQGCEKFSTCTTQFNLHLKTLLFKVSLNKT